MSPGRLTRVGTTRARLTVVVAGLVTLASAQTPSSVFRARVDLVQIDVSVLDFGSEP